MKHLVKFNESLPRENSIRQLEMVAKLSKKTDIGNRISDMNKEGANIEYIQNPIETGIESMEDYQKDNKTLKHLKSFNESIKDEKLLEFCKNHLSNLIDDEFEITLYTENGIAIDNEGGFYWSDVKDDLIPFFQILTDKYKLVEFNRGGEDSVVTFNDGGGNDYYSLENVINDEIGDDLYITHISFRVY